MLKLVFADNPAYVRNEGFRTAHLSLPFRYLEAEKDGKNSMAEGEGFEPSMGANPCRFSRPVHSTALPPLRERDSCASYTTWSAMSRDAI